MRVLVIGAGFIGRHLIEALQREGHEVSVLDRVASRKPLAGVRVFLGDVRDPEVVTEAVQLHDGVINLSGILGTQETINSPHASVDTNIHGALNVFEACRPTKLNPDGVKCVQIAVGNHFMNNTYAITKTAVEKFALMYNKENGCRIAIVRGLNAYGEYQKHKPVRKITPTFIVRALNGLPIQVYGSGEQVMDMIYVADLAEVLMRALVRDHGIYDKVFEAGTGRRTTVNEIADTVNKIVGNTAPHQGRVHVPMRPGEPENSEVLADPSTLIPLGIFPTMLTPLELGLARTVAWYHANYDWREETPRTDHKYIEHSTYTGKGCATCGCPATQHG